MKNYAIAFSKLITIVQLIAEVPVYLGVSLMNATIKKVPFSSSYSIYFLFSKNVRVVSKKRKQVKKFSGCVTRKTLF